MFLRGGNDDYGAAGGHEVAYLCSKIVYILRPLWCLSTQYAQQQ
jgi:hypothetical protein